MKLLARLSPPEPFSRISRAGNAGVPEVVSAEDVGPRSGTARFALGTSSCGGGGLLRGCVGWISVAAGKEAGWSGGSVVIAGVGRGSVGGGDRGVGVLEGGGGGGGGREFSRDMDRVRA